VSGEKDQNVFFKNNISYKTLAILMKFGTVHTSFLNKFALTAVTTSSASTHLCRQQDLKSSYIPGGNKLWKKQALPA